MRHGGGGNYEQENRQDDEGRKGEMRETMNRSVEQSRLWLCSLHFF